MAVICCFQMNPSHGMTVEGFKAWLLQFETDHDGRVSHEELKEALQSFRVWFPRWKARQAKKVADTNHNVQIEGAKEIERPVSSGQQHFHMKILGRNRTSETKPKCSNRSLSRNSKTD